MNILPYVGIADINDVFIHIAINILVMDMIERDRFYLSDVKVVYINFMNVREIICNSHFFECDTIILCDKKHMPIAMNLSKSSEVFICLVDINSSVKVIKNIISRFLSGVYVSMPHNLTPLNDIEMIYLKYILKHNGNCEVIDFLNFSKKQNYNFVSRLCFKLGIKKISHIFIP